MFSQSRIVIGLSLLATAMAGPVAADGELLAPPSAEQVRTQALNWVAGRGVTDEALLEQVGQLWAFGDETPSARERFDALVQTFTLIDPKARKLVEACTLQNPPLLAPEKEAEAALSAPDAAEDDDTFYRANLQLYYARYLSQRRMYEKALAAFADIQPQRVIDPATYLFYKAVCEHRLLMKEDGLATIDQLLTSTEDVPVRYSTVATLMQYDLQALKEKSLDEIARKMSDVERRLDLGHGGQKVQKVEEEIIASLDELIKKLEQQSGGGGGGGGGGSGQNRSNQSGSPADDSTVKGTTAPGEADRKDIGHQIGWGALPPKAATKAKNMIDRDFPAHYRQAIDQYFKKLSTRRANVGR